MNRLLCLLVLAAFHTNSAANAWEGCDRFIHPDTLEQSSSTSVKMAYINSVSQDSYESDNEGIKASISIPIEGISIGGEGNWSRFSEKRSILNQITKWSLNFQQSLSVSRSTVSNGSWDAVRDCLRSRTNGVFLAPYQPSGETASIAVMYRAPSTGSPSVPLNWSIIGGDATNIISSIDRGDEDVVTLNWPLNSSELSVIVSGGGYRSNQVMFRRPPEIEKAPPASTWTAYVQGQVKNTNVHVNWPGLPDRVSCPNYSVFSAPQWDSRRETRVERVGQATYVFFDHGRNGDFHTWNARLNGEQISNDSGQVLVFHANDFAIYCL